MTEEINMHRLGTQLVQGNQRKTCTKDKLRFTDYAIERYQSNFITKEGKIKDRIYVLFNLDKNSVTKNKI